MTKQDVKKAFKSIGYNVKIKKQSLFGNSWYIINSGIVGIDGGNVFTREIYEAHKSFFELRNTFNKVVLDDGLKILI